MKKKQGPASARAIKRRFKRFTCIGKRCSYYAPGCPTCEEYRRLMETGRFSHNVDEWFEYACQHDGNMPSITWAELASNPQYAKKPPQL